MFRLSVVLLLLACLWPAAPALAVVSSMAMIPSREELVIRPGESQTFTVNVSNPGQRPLRIRAYLSDWALQPEGELAFAPAGQAPHSAAHMIAFSPAQFVVEPEAVQRVTVTVSVPAGTPGGEYHGMLFFESAPPPTPDRHIGPAFTFSQRIGNTIYVAVPPFQRKATVTALAYLPPQERTPARMGMAIENRGTAHVRASGRLRIEGLDGVLVEEKVLSDLPVLRESKRLFFLPLSRALPLGRFRAILTLDFGGEELIEAVTQIER